MRIIYGLLPLVLPELELHGAEYLLRYGTEVPTVPYCGTVGRYLRYNTILD